MTNLKEKITATAEHLKNAVADTAGKLGHAAAEVVHKGERELSLVTRKAQNLAVETADKLKHEVDKIAEKAAAPGTAPSDKTKDAGKAADGVEVTGKSSGTPKRN